MLLNLRSKIQIMACYYFSQQLAHNIMNSPEATGESYYNTVIRLRAARRMSQRENLETQRARQQQLLDVSINLTDTLDNAIELLAESHDTIEYMRRQIAQYRTTLRRLQHPNGLGTIGDPIDLTRRPPIQTINIDSPPSDDEDTILAGPDDTGMEDDDDDEPDGIPSNHVALAIASSTARHTPRHAPAA